MKNIEELDGLLKNGMEVFSPTPPDVWSQIAQQVQPVPNPGAQSIWQSVQQASVWVKSAVFVGVTAVVSTVVVLQLPSEKGNSIAPNQVVLQAQPAEIIAPSTDTTVAYTSLVQAEKELIKPKMVLPKNASHTATTILAEPSQIETALAAEIRVEKHEKPGLMEAPKVTAPVNSIPLTENFDGEVNGEPSPETNYYPKPDFGNFISPNGDGKNDTWEIAMPTPKFFRVRVFDKQLQLVFESDNPEKHWAGSYQKSGIECENGVYTFVIEYQYNNQDKVQKRQGIISLVR